MFADQLPASAVQIGTHRLSLRFQTEAGASLMCGAYPVVGDEVSGGHCRSKSYNVRCRSQNRAEQSPNWGAWTSHGASMGGEAPGIRYGGEAWSHGRGANVAVATAASQRQCACIIDLPGMNSA